MKAGLIRLAVAGMMVAGTCVAVAQQAPAATKTTTKAPAARTEWAGVVAKLTVKQGAKVYNLTAADAKVVAQIKDLVAKGATVIVHGVLGKDETDIAVTKCQEKKAETAKKK
jgi:threonine dehydrogenase-like Zn-dependent dehydrogenase